MLNLLKNSWSNLNNMFDKLIKKVTEGPKKAMEATKNLTKAVSEKVSNKAKGAAEGVKKLNPFKK